MSLVMQSFLRPSSISSKCIDHNKKTGNDAKKCAYYEERHDIFHGDDNISLPAVYSSRKGLV